MNKMEFISEFDKSLNEGKIIESIVKKNLEKRGFEVIDLSDKKIYQKIDVDFMIKRGNSKMLIEVKADYEMNKTGNIFLEDGMERKTGFYPGWLRKSKADLLWYHDAVKNIGYVLHFRKMANDVANIYGIKKFNNLRDDCIGYGYVVPADDLAKKGWLLEVVEIGGENEI